MDLLSFEHPSMLLFCFSLTQHDSSACSSQNRTAIDIVFFFARAVKVVVFCHNFFPTILALKDCLVHIEQCKHFHWVIKKGRQTFVFKVGAPQRNEMTYVKVKVHVHLRCSSHTQASFIFKNF